MKLKCQPEDFRVEERTAFTPEGGAFALYRLTKRGLGTPEAIDAILKRWRIARDRISYGGLKDRHAVTVQHVTIDRGPHRNLKQTNLDLAYVGQCSRPFESKDILANAFTIVLRDAGEREAAGAAQALEAISRDGLPNYFDDQRFGSDGRSGEFIARAWCLGDYERALWLILADPNPHDRPSARSHRRLISKHWGDWARVASGVGRSPWLGVIRHLVDRPADFRGALARVRPDLRSLYLGAFQSHLWNCMLAELLCQRFPSDRLVHLSVAGYTVPFPHALEPEERDSLRSVDLPLPSARSRNDMATWQEIAQASLERVGLTLEQLRVKYPRDSFFSKGSRPALYIPLRIGHRIADDELYDGRKKVVIDCDLPRGAYATILTRRCTLAT